MWKLILLGIVTIAAAVPPQQRDSENNLRAEQYVVPELVPTLDQDTRTLSSSNTYSLFTRQNPRVSQTLVIDDIDSINNSNFNGRLPTVVIVHGWLIKQDSDMNPTVRDAFLEKSDVNFIVMEWRRLAIADYVTAVNGVPDVGIALGEFLAYLNRIGGAQFNQMHIIGFGLGAHIVGNAGRHLGGRVGRVTGLDPAGSLWQNNPNKLDAADGIYVEAIHTNGATKSGLGYGSAIAMVDFFPNGGNSQPGCATNICSHNRSWQLFASTVTNNHLIGKRCSTTLQLTWNTCRGTELHMGNDILDKSGSGMYRVDTSRTYPY